MSKQKALHKISEEIESRLATCRKLETLEKWLQNATIDLPDEVWDKVSVYCGTQLDFDGLTREEVLLVIAAIPGRWSKSPHYTGDAINYVLEKPHQPLIRLYAAPPPPSCRVEWEEVIVPARTERRAKIVCKDEELNETNV